MILGITYRYEWIETAAQLAITLTLDLGKPGYLICDCTSFSATSIPKGFISYPSGDTIPLIIGNKLGAAADNYTIWEVDLQDMVKPLGFQPLAERYQTCTLSDKELLLATYYRYPSLLYAALAQPQLYPAVAETEELKVYPPYLEALLDAELTSSVWSKLTKTEGMKLFGGRKTFLDYLSDGEDKGRCRGLAPLLQPFALKFTQTLDVNYLQSFGRWALRSRLYWGGRNHPGVCKYGSGYYCNFNAKALHRWTELVDLLTY